jgi:POT family proton-dependent oligopeptide transporter
MNLHGAPNDIIQNLNPISIVILIPILDFIVYPGLRKAGIHFTPIKRMATGFIFATFAMVAACVTQYYVYKLNPCGNQAGTCRDADEKVLFSEINVWVQTLPYVLIGIAEIFTNVTSLEYAFSKAPTNMRSLVMAINLLMSAISSAIGQALVPLSADPLLIWNYGVVAVVSLVGGVTFWFCFHNLDKDEDKWNMLQQTEYLGRNGSVSVPEPAAASVAGNSDYSGEKVSTKV